MKLLQAAGQEWRDLKYSLAAGTPPAGTFMVRGPSEEITVQVQSILADTCQREYHLKYFLCSGSGIFRLPCFLPVTNTKVAPEPFNASHFLTGGAFARELFVKETLSAVVEELEQTGLRKSQLPQVILVEYLTPPAWFDLSFTVSLLRSELPQHIPLVVLFHQSSASDSLPEQDCDSIERMLLTLYLCAGRMPLAEWRKIRDQLPEPGRCDRFIASRQVGSDTWICYANRQVAELAERVFQTTQAVRKHALARSVLQALPHSIGYPLLAIASETDDLATMLSIYSQSAVNTALAEPGGLISYFDHLQKIAQKAGATTLASIAHVSYLSSQLLLSREHSIQIYKRLQETILPDSIDKEIQGFFWYTLGQQCVLMKHPEAWGYAADCFRLSRECFQCAGLEKRPRVQMGLALIANGEALIAYKRGQGEQARQLEEFALEQSKDLVQATNFQVHVRINLGDVLLRSLGDREAALVRYGEALLEVSQIRKKFKLQTLPKRLTTFRQQAALRLGSTFVQAERYNEAIDFLEHFLSYAKTDAAASGFGEESSTVAFKTRLALIQAYLKTGQQRKAAAAYWHILRHPQWLEPVALKEVAAKLTDCRPAIHQRLQRRMQQIVSEQEAIIADTVKVQEVLTEMQTAQHM